MTGCAEMPVVDKPNSSGRAISVNNPTTPRLFGTRRDRGGLGSKYGGASFIVLFSDLGQVNDARVAYGKSEIRSRFFETPRLERQVFRCKAQLDTQPLMYFTLPACTYNIAHNIMDPELGIEREYSISRGVRICRRNSHSPVTLRETR